MPATIEKRRLDRVRRHALRVHVIKAARARIVHGKAVGKGDKELRPVDVKVLVLDEGSTEGRVRKYCTSFVLGMAKTLDFAGVLGDDKVTLRVLKRSPMVACAEDWIAVKRDLFRAFESLRLASSDRSQRR